MCVKREVDIPWEAPNVCKILVSVPFRLNGYTIVRTVILFLTFAKTVMAIIQDISIVSESPLAQDLNYMGFTWDLINLGEILLYIHTCIVCVTGIDGLYMMHLMIHPVSKLFTICWFLVNDVILTNELETYDLIQSIFRNIIYQILISTGYIFWGMKTLLLFVEMYRKTVTQYEDQVGRNAIFERVVGPFLLFGIIQIIYLATTHALFVLYADYKWYFSSTTFSQAILHAIMQSLKLHMFLGLDPRKRYVQYLCNGKKTTLEKWIFSLILSLLVISIPLFVIYYHGDDTYMSENDFVLIGVHMVDLLVAALVLVNYILMWYYAVEELKVDDLSVNEFEWELYQMYGKGSSTFIGGDARVRGQRTNNKDEWMN